MDNNYQALTNFLIYSYFGIVPQSVFKEEKGEDYKDYCVKRAIIKAYSDATNEGAYNTLFKKEISNRDELLEQSNEARINSAGFLFGKIKELETVTNFNSWHHSVCKELVDKYSAVKDGETKFFEYGNAQKWVNMTMKYLWMLGILPKKITENDLHIPIDSFIIDALWKADKSLSDKFPLKNDRVKRGYDYKKPSDYVLGWSKWEEQQYDKFRDSILKSDYSLSWENDAWITQAEKRKANDRKKQYEKLFKNDTK